jgi:hypothetical protein
MSSSVLILAVIGLAEISGAEVIKTLRVDSKLTLEGERFERLHPNISTIVYSEHSGVSKKLNPLAIKNERKFPALKQNSISDNWNILKS